MQLTCLYHPTLDMRVLDDEEEFNRLLATGVWFTHPNDAKAMRETYERRLQETRLHTPKRKGRGNSKQSSEDGRSAA